MMAGALMARRVFFSFHYQRDLWRANVVRNSGAIEGVAAAGFYDSSLWEGTKRRGDGAVKTTIDGSLDGTIATVVLIGLETANRSYVSYEVERSVARGNAILGVRINKIKDKDGQIDPPGEVPTSLVKIGAPIYTWEYGKLGDWIDEAYKEAKSSS